MPLPSGLATLSTLRAFAPDYPAVMGRYAPLHADDGDIADTAALESWIARLAAGPSAGP